MTLAPAGACWTVPITRRRTWGVDGPGEVLLGVVDGPALVTVGGLTADPYSADPRLGRLRHVYVRPEVRCAGVGRRLRPRLVLPVPSTVAVLLKHAGLVTAPQRRRALGHPGWSTAEMNAPHAIRTADCKGECKTRGRSPAWHPAQRV